MTDRKAQEWRQRFLRFEKSRQSISAFCREEGVSAPSFYVWRKRLRAAATARAGTTPAPEGFRPVRLLPAANMTAQLPGGTQLVVPMSDPEGLRTVIDAVARVDAQLFQGVRPC
jgi:transposase-like protein